MGFRAGVLGFAFFSGLGIAGGAVPAGWVVDAHSSATVEFGADNLITIRSPNNVHAHGEREIGMAAPFRVSAAIKAPEVADWAPSLFLYWGPGVYGVVCDGGDGSTAYRLTTTASSDWTYNPDTGGLDKAPVDSVWHDVALVLTDDAVLFQVREEEGGKWQTKRRVERTGEMAGAPAKLIVGKGYYEKDKYGAPDLDNDYAVAGEMTTALVRGLKVEGISGGEELKEMAGTDEQYRDVFGEAELAKEGDPTYDSVAGVWPPLQYGRDALGVARGPEEFTVLPNGVIGAWTQGLIEPRRGWFVVGDGQRFGGETTVTRRLDEGWLPVLTCGYKHEGLEYEQTMAGWSEGMSPDAPLIGLMRLTVKNPGGAAARTKVAFYGEHEKRNLLEWDEMELGPGETKSVWLELTFPMGSDKLMTAAKAGEAGFEQKVAEVKAAWRKIVAEGMQIDVPEERVMNAWRAWHVWMMTDVDKIKGKMEFHDGGGWFYELVYGFSAARGAELADMLGRTADARAWLEMMLEMVDSDGRLVVNFGLPDHGSVLSAVAHHYRYTGDKAWLKSVAPKLVKMCAWAKTARAKAMADLPTTSPVYGMIKDRPYCDHPEPAYYLVADVLLAGGMKDVAAVLPEVGLGEEAKWIGGEGEAYAADLKRVVERSVFDVDGQELLPLFPETRELLRASGWMASDYYGLLVTALLERGGDVVPAGSRYSRMIVDALEKRGGLLMGVSRFWGGIDHAYAAGYWADRLRSGEPEKALLGLYASMAYGMSRDTFSSVEVTFAKDGKNFPTLPHNFSNLEQIRLVKNLLVDEVGEGLVLGAGIAREWLADGKHVEVKGANTQWGKVGYRMESAVGKGVMTAKMDVGEARPKEGVKVFFRHPEGAAIKDVEAKGGKVLAKGNDWVKVMPEAGEVALRVKF